METIKIANLYPFVTKSQLKARLESDSAFRCEAIVILHALQTGWEQNAKATKEKNRQGFMSSHAVRGTEVARKLLAGEALTAEDMVHVDRIAPRYTRQLAVYYRAKAIAEQPALKAVAALFSADTSGETPAVEAAELDAETADETISFEN